MPPVVPKLAWAVAGRRTVYLELPYSRNWKFARLKCGVWQLLLGNARCQELGEREGGMSLSERGERRLARRPVPVSIRARNAVESAAYPAVNTDPLYPHEAMFLAVCLSTTIGFHLRNSISVTRQCAALVRRQEANACQHARCVDQLWCHGISGPLSTGCQSAEKWPSVGDRSTGFSRSMQHREPKNKASSCWLVSGGCPAQTSDFKLSKMASLSAWVRWQSVWRNLSQAIGTEEGRIYWLLIKTT